MHAYVQAWNYKQCLALDSHEGSPLTARSIFVSAPQERENQPSPQNCSHGKIREWGPKSQIKSTGVHSTRLSTDHSPTISPCCSSSSAEIKHGEFDHSPGVQMVATDLGSSKCVPLRSFAGVSDSTTGRGGPASACTCMKQLVKFEDFLVMVEL